MKNIKLSFFCTIIFATSMSGMENSVLKQVMTALSTQMQDLLLANENLQQAKDNREFTRENQQFSRENHSENLQQAQNNRQFTKEDHEENQEIALDKRRVSLTNEESNLFINNSNMKKLLALNEQKANRTQAENAFSQCLVSHRHSSDLGYFGIPKVCEDPAKILRLLGCSSTVDNLIEEFQK